MKIYSGNYYKSLSGDIIGPVIFAYGWFTCEYTEPFDEWNIGGEYIQSYEGDVRNDHPKNLVSQVIGDELKLFLVKRALLE